MAGRSVLSRWQVDAADNAAALDQVAAAHAASFGLSYSQDRNFSLSIRSGPVAPTRTASTSPRWINRQICVGLTEASSAASRTLIRRGAEGADASAIATAYSLYGYMDSIGTGGQLRVDV